MRRAPPVLPPLGRVETAERGAAGFEPWEPVEERIAARLREMRR